MIQRPGGLGLVLETTHSVGIVGQTGWQNLDRDVPRQTFVAGPIHLAHPSRAERREDLVRPEPGTGGKRHPESRLRRG